MNIRNPEDYLGSFWDWEVFNKCFEGTKIRITDVDGLVERNGHFLLLETKRPGVEVPLGQAILFDRICRDPHWLVLVIWGETDQPECWQLWGNPNKKHGNLQDLQAFISQWFRYADGKKSA